MGNRGSDGLAMEGVFFFLFFFFLELIDYCLLANIFHKTCVLLGRVVLEVVAVVGLLDVNMYN